MGSAYRVPSGIDVFLDMTRAAREYCSLIESIDEMEQQEWFQQLAILLPRLHAAIVGLGHPEAMERHVPAPDFEDRFELFSRLHVTLGERDAYWMEFDIAQDGQTMSGSLADDLTDIYFDLRDGLHTLERDPRDSQRAVTDWQTGYEVHWGQHLLDAERHLYALQASHQLLPV